MHIDYDINKYIIPSDIYKGKCIAEIDLVELDGYLRKIERYDKYSWLSNKIKEYFEQPDVFDRLICELQLSGLSDYMARCNWKGVTYE